MTIVFMLVTYVGGADTD